MTKFIAIFLLIFITIVLLPAPAQAFSLVPCGRSDQKDTPADAQCNITHLVTLIMRMINYLISVAGLVAMYQILSAGFNMTTALGNAEKIQHSKEQVSQAVVGFSIVVLAFVFVNLLVNGVLGDPSGAVRKWWDPNCLYNITNPSPECPRLEIGAGEAEERAVAGGTCKGVVCGDSSVNICGTTKPANNCAASAVNDYTDEIRQGAGSKTICSGIDTIKFLKAIMANESSGDPSAVSPKGSLGLFQLQISTANDHKDKCGVSENIDRAWLTNSDNAAKQACIAAEYLKTLAGPCGCDVKQIAAAYNGGAEACAVSLDCGPAAGANQCSICSDQGTKPTKKWECLWEDSDHKTCNADLPSNYAETRQYAPKVQYCYNQF